jgi:hypothetical protein
MPSKVQICNRALALCRLRSISALTDATPEAETCAYWYDEMREELLAVYDWPFATLTVEMAEHAEDPPADWAYRFALPVDVAWAREVVTEGQSPTDPPNAFKLELLPDQSAVTLLTNVNPAQLRYTFNCDDEALFDRLFATALGYRLAGMVALVLQKDAELSAQMDARAAVAIGEARLQVRVSERVERAEPESIRARA